MDKNRAKLFLAYNISFKYRQREIKSKGMEIHANTNQKKAQLAVVFSDKTDFLATSGSHL
jgi:hypothetical protein